MFGVAFDQRFDECSFAHARRANHCDYYWRSFLREAVDEGDMEALLFDLQKIGQSRARQIEGIATYVVRAHCLLRQSTRVCVCKGFGI